MGPAERFLALIRPMGGTVLPRPRVVDWVAGATLAATVAAADLASPAASAAVGLIGAGTVIIRRVWPLHAILILGLLSAAVEVVVEATAIVIEPTVAEAIAGFVLLYTIGRSAPPKTVAVAAFIAFAVLPVASNFNPANGSSVMLTVLEALVLALIVAAGLLVRSLADGREQRTLTMELQDRNLLANDIHDSFAHHMSAIAVRPEAARQLDDPAELDEALRAIKKGPRRASPICATLLPASVDQTKSRGRFRVSVILSTSLLS